MGLTVQNIVNAALYEVNITPPASLIASNASSLQCKNLLYAQSRQLRNTRTWPQQKKKFSFTEVSGQRSYQLPTDYYASLPDTQWDDARRMRLIGPISDGEYTDRSKGGYATSNVPAFRIFGPDMNPNSAGGQIEVWPIPSSSGESLSIEYISSSMFLPPNWSPSTPYLIGNLVNANGNIYQCASNGTSGSTAPITKVQAIVDGGTTWNYQAASYETIVTNNDISIFDDDIMIEGFKWRYLQTNKLEWESFYQAYVPLLNSAQARWNGTFIGSMTGPRFSRRFTVPPGSWTL